PTCHFRTIMVVHVAHHPTTRPPKSGNRTTGRRPSHLSCYHGGRRRDHRGYRTNHRSYRSHHRYTREPTGTNHTVRGSHRTSSPGSHRRPHRISLGNPAPRSAPNTRNSL